MSVPSPSVKRSSDTLMEPTRFLEIPVTKLPTDDAQNPRVTKTSWTPWRMPQISQATASPTVRGIGTCRHRYMKPPPELTWTTWHSSADQSPAFHGTFPGSLTGQFMPTVTFLQCQLSLHQCSTFTRNVTQFIKALMCRVRVKN